MFLSKIALLKMLPNKELQEMNLTDDQKFEILKVAYEERRKEVAFPRERSLKVASWMVGVLLAFSASTTAINSEKALYLLISLLALTIVVTFYLLNNHKIYRERWARAADVEEALQFFDVGVYITNKSLNDPAVPDIPLGPVIRGYEESAFVNFLEQSHDAAGGWPRYGEPPAAG